MTSLTPPPGDAEAAGSERIAAVMKQLYGMALFDAASVLVVAMAEVVDQAPDRDAAWNAILKAIEAERATIQ